MFVEPVIGAGGVYPPLPGYIEGLAALCERTGVLAWLTDLRVRGSAAGSGVERFGIIFDMIVFAKGVTSGYLPLGGVVVAEHVAQLFWQAAGGPVLRHGATYAAHAAAAQPRSPTLELALGRDGLLTCGRELERARCMTRPAAGCRRAWPRCAAASAHGGRRAQRELLDADRLRSPRS